jgi:hypothetical protein
MIWYVALIALLNLGLGYALANFLRNSARPALATGDDSNYDTSSDAGE